MEGGDYVLCVWTELLPTQPPTVVYIITMRFVKYIQSGISFLYATVKTNCDRLIIIIGLCIIPP